jgi:anti-sigma B factor antagonist
MSEIQTPGDATPRVTVRRFAAHGVCLQGLGELDLLAAPLFGQAIAAAIAKGHRHVVVDLGRATFLDCACLGAILAGMRPLRTEDDAALVLARANGPVERLLSLLEFDQTCSIVSNVQVATLLALDANGGRAEGWRSDERPAVASATDLNPPIQSGGNDELSP